MDSSSERDESIERLLEQSLRTRRPDPPGSCPDAETLAAWVDGDLSGSALTMAQSHVAECSRCQSIVGAIARSATAVPASEAGKRSRRWVPWLVPLTAAAAVMTIWVATSRNAAEPPSAVVPFSDVQHQPPVTTTEPVPGSESRAPLTRQDQAQAKQEAQPPLSGTNADQRSAPAPEEPNTETARLQAAAPTQERDASAPAVAAPSAPVNVATERSANRLAETVTLGVEIVSPDPAVRWRIVGPRVERTATGGSSWQAVPTGGTSELVAGSAPSTSVCWLVGRAGVVLLSTDGGSFRRVPFPELTDLSAVRATDDRSASITTADGRVFVTSDAGATWARR